MNLDYQRVIDAADDWIVNRPGTIVAAFLVLTVVFAIGLSNVSTQAGTESFSENVPEQTALTAINQRFEPPFAPGTGTTQLIQTGENALSREGLMRMLRLIDSVERQPDLRVAGATSAAAMVARELDPNATTTEAQLRAVRKATGPQIEAAVRAAARDNPGFTPLLSKDFNPQSASASATVAVLSHDIPVRLDQEAGASGATNPLTPIQLQIQYRAANVGGDIRVFGSGITSVEFANVIGDTLVIVIPAAAVLIVVFLVFAYRDPVDLLLGVLALVMTVVWTLGFMGLAGIAFNQILIAVPPLLLAVGIDYGIHAINRYREERVDGYAIGPGMRRTTDQLLVAFFIVTTTSTVGFLSNLTSALLPIRDFGVVAGIGITFTALIFGVFVPAGKVGIDRLRERYPIPVGSQRPLGYEGSVLGRVLSGGVVVARRFPVGFLLVVAILTAGSATYATGLDTTFTQENFLPPAQTPGYLAVLPPPFRPQEYTVTRDINFLEDNFESGEQQQVTMYVQGPMTRDDALEMLYRAGEDPPETFVRDGRHARDQSIVTVIQSWAASDPEFRTLVERNDRDGDGIPERNLGRIYDVLLSSPARDRARDFITADRRSARVGYAVKADASQAEVTADARAVADRYRFETTATGGIVVFQAIADLILRSALESLLVALVGASLFLVFIYWLLVGRPSLGVVNVVPILVTVSLLAGTMRLVGLSLNAFTATILSITIGLGIDYSVHVVQRFSDEFDGDAIAALQRTILGTGGALAGSVLTTVFGIGVLVLSVFPAIGQFGLLTGLSVVYSFFASLLVLPSVLVVWDRLVGSRHAGNAGTDAEEPGVQAE